jgi:hypothetical protein
MACPSYESCTVTYVRYCPRDGKSITDVGEDCLGYHMRYDFIEYILFQREVLDLIRLIPSSEAVNT